jgi:hypothetical protein
MARTGIRAFLVMSDPFDSSHSKINWAKKNLATLKGEVDASLSQKNFYETWCEPHPEMPDHLVQKMRVVKQIPEDWSHLTGTVVSNLRASLDHAVYDVAVAAGCPKPQNAYFPFSRSAATFESNMKGRCADVPKDVFPLFRRLKPYKGGNELLWALNTVRVTNEHIPLTTVGAATFMADVSIRAVGRWSMPSVPVWDRRKNEMELCTIGPNTKLHGHFNFGFYIAFGEIEWLEGKNAIPTLDQFVDMVETILGQIEAESKRLGIVK